MSDLGGKERLASILAEEVSPYLKLTKTESLHVVDGFRSAIIRILQSDEPQLTIMRFLTINLKHMQARPGRNVVKGTYHEIPARDVPSVKFTRYFMKLFAK